MGDRVGQGEGDSQGVGLGAGYRLPARFEGSRQAKVARLGVGTVPFLGRQWHGTLWGTRVHVPRSGHVSK